MKKQVVLFLSAMCIFCMLFSTMVLANENVAEVGGVGYPTLAAAYNAVVQGSGDTITLLKTAGGNSQAIQGAGLIIDENVTIDFNSNHYIFTTPAVGSTGTEHEGFQILEGNTVTLKNGYLGVSEEASDDYGMLIQNYANLTLIDMELDGTNVTRNVSQVPYVLSNNSGKVEIKGNTSITATNSVPGAVAFDVCKYSSYPVPEVYIDTTGTITGKIEVSEGTTLEISAGEFHTSTPIQLAWCANGYKPVEKVNGVYGIEEMNKVASVDGVIYESLADAVSEAAEGKTINLLKDFSGEGIVIDKNITIDFGEKQYIFTTPAVGSTGTEHEGFQILEGNTVTLKNGYLGVSEEASDDYGMLIQNYANLTLIDMELDGTNVTRNVSQVPYVLSNNSGKVEIKGNTSITATNSVPGAVAFDVCKYASYPVPEVYIDTTGTIIGKIEVSEGTTLEISGGLFTAELSNEWCANGFKVIEASSENEGEGLTPTKLYTVKAFEVAAKIGDKKYESLKKAYDAAIDNDTITLEKSTSGEGIIIDKDITIDFGGNTYTFTEPPVGSAGTETQGFHIKKNNTVTLKNGTLNVDEDYEINYAMLIQNYANLTLEDMNLDGTNLDRLIIRKANGEITNSYSYVLSNNCGTVNITGNTNITANDEGDSAFAFDVCKFQSYDAPTVNVSTTGLISGDIEVTTGTNTTGDGTPTLAISKGTYTVPIEIDWCATGFVPKTNSDGTYGVIEAGSIVEVNGQGFSTLTAAYNSISASEGGTITFITNASGEGLIIDKDVTIDFAGYTYTFTEPPVGSTGTETQGFHIKKNNTVTLKNGTLNVDEDYEINYAMLIQNYANLTLEDMNLDGTNLDRLIIRKANGEITNSYSYVLSNNCGTVNITGNTNITANDEGDSAFAFDVCKFQSYDAPTVNVSTTGLISGDIEVTTGTNTTGDGTPTLAISAGTYTMSIEKTWCANGFRPVQNEDKTWTVEEDIIKVVVIFDSNGGSEVANYESESVGLYFPVTKPEDPTRAGYAFKGWYSGDVAYDFSVVIKESTTFTLVAKWESTTSGAPGATAGGGGGSSTPKFKVNLNKVENAEIKSNATSVKEGDTVTITVKPSENYEVVKVSVIASNGKNIEVILKDGKYTFVMPEASVNVKVELKDINEDTEVSGDSFETSFTDVEEDSCYYDAVVWAEKNGITKGTSQGKFSPEDNCTRAEIITAIWRAAGSPKVEKTTTPFEDVDVNSYYYDAILWAEQNGVTEGTSATTFSPDRVCTRAEILTLIWRLDGKETAQNETEFDDVEENTFYTEAVDWGVSEKITNGTDENLFSPEEFCNRVQMVTFLYRYYNN